MKVIQVISSTLFYLFSFLVIYNLLSLYFYHKDQDFENLNKQYFASTGNASQEIRKEIINALHISKDGRPVSDPAKIDSFLAKNFSKDDILILGTSSEEIACGFEQAKRFKHGDIHFLKNVNFGVENAYISSSNNVAWISIVGYFKTIIDSLILPLRHSAILIKYDETWKIHKTQTDWFYDTNLLLSKIVFAVIFSIFWAILLFIKIVLYLISWKLQT
jgi:hypothetical protein